MKHLKIYEQFDEFDPFGEEVIWQGTDFIHRQIMDTHGRPVIMRIGKFCSKLGLNQMNIEKMHNKFLGYLVEWNSEGPSFLISPNGEREQYENDNLINKLKEEMIEL